MCGGAASAQPPNGTCATALELQFGEAQEVEMDGAPSNGVMHEVAVWFHTVGTGQVLNVSVNPTERSAWLTSRRSTEQCVNTQFFWASENRPYVPCNPSGGFCSYQHVVVQTVPGMHYYILINSYALQSGTVSYTAEWQEPVSGCLDPEACNYNASANLYGFCEYTSCVTEEEGQAVIAISYNSQSPWDANAFSFCPLEFELYNADSSFFWSMPDLTYHVQWNEQTSHQSIFYPLTDSSTWLHYFYEPYSLTPTSLFDGELIVRSLPEGCYTLHFPGWCSYPSSLGFFDQQGNLIYQAMASTDTHFICFDAVAGCTNPLALNYNPEATYNDNSCILQGDVNADQLVTIADLQLLIANLGCTTCSTLDMNSNGLVDVNDIMLLLSWMGN